VLKWRRANDKIESGGKKKETKQKKKQKTKKQKTKNEKTRGSEAKERSLALVFLLSQYFWFLAPLYDV